MQKIDLLSEQINFLIQNHEESLEECNKEFEALMIAVEASIASKSGGQEASDGAETVRDVLSQKIGQMCDEFEEDIESMREQRLMVEEALKLPVGDKRDEMIKTILEDAGELEDLEKFKKLVLEDKEESKKGFLFMIGDIKSALDEGGIEELEILFEAMELDQAKDREQDDELDGCCGGKDDCTNECGGCSLEDGVEEVTEAFKKMSEPFNFSEDKPEDLS
jgi:hypothetical protein